jgi:flagellin
LERPKKKLFRKEAGHRNSRRNVYMIINHNLMAMNTHRQLGINNTAGSKSLEKLSSGFRINRAGDDAAGLAISEKMRGQIRGLNQASRNAQDGISLIQTTEGALNETHAILQRMRELATQASTDTNTLTDRKEIQKEINQLLDEIDRIGNQTEFNTQKLLNGSYSSKVLHIGANIGQNMDINIGDMRTTSLGAGDVTLEGTVPAVAAEATSQGITFRAVTAGEAGNDITIKFVAAEGANQSTSVAVANGNEITVTLGTDGDSAVNATTAGVVDAINANDDAKALVVASGGDTTVAAVTAEDIVLSGGADETLGDTVTTLDTISNLKVDDTVIDSVTEDALDTLDNEGVLTQDGANKAIANVNNAIEQVSAERSKLGAIQNRLEHTIANLGTSAENLQAAESRIRDLDMAEEIMAFTKNNILQQAATAMLAQANQQPQSVLQLLR